MLALRASWRRCEKGWMGDEGCRRRYLAGAGLGTRVLTFAVERRAASRRRNDESKYKKVDYPGLQVYLTKGLDTLSKNEKVGDTMAGAWSGCQTYQIKASAEISVGPLCCEVGQLTFLGPFLQQSLVPSSQAHLPLVACTCT